MNLGIINSVYLDFKNKAKTIHSWLDKSLNEKEGTGLFELFRNDLFYNGVIITLYGLFEKFVDQICLSFIDTALKNEEEMFENNKSVRSKMLSTYLQNVLEYVQNPQRHTNIDFSDTLVSSLFEGYYSAQRNNDYSKIDSRFLIFHSANVKSAELFNIFKKIGIEDFGVQICDSQSFADFLQDNLGFEEKDISMMKTNDASSIYNVLNSLVDQRNTIAHSGFSDSKISFKEVFETTIPYLISLASSIKDILVNTLSIKFSLPNKFRFRDVSIIKVYNNKLVCHSNEDYLISIGDLLILKNSENYIVAEIKSIGLNEKLVTKTDEGSSLDYCFNIDKTAKESFSLISYIRM